MLEIAICFNEEETIFMIEEKLHKLKKTIMLETDVFYCCDTLVDHIRNGTKYDILYLNIELNIENGLEITKKIRELDKRVLIIWISSFDNYARYINNLLEISIFKVINKPMEANVIEQCFKEAITELSRTPRYFHYSFNKIMYKVAIDEIMYFQSEGRVTYIVTIQTCKRCYVKLNLITEKLLNAKVFFFRVHQSVLINPRYVSRYSFEIMELIDGTTFTISESRRIEVKRLYSILENREIKV